MTDRPTSGAAVVIMARSPYGARPPKIRLTDGVPVEHNRRRLYAAFLADVIMGIETIAGVTIRVAYTKDGGIDGFDEVGVSAHQLMIQHGRTLGDRERGVFEDLFRDRFSPVVIIGSDLPTLPPERVTEALARLRDVPDQVVLGPASDGGYYLIGLTAVRDTGSVPDLFTGIRWSTASTLADTVAAAKRCDLTVDLLTECYDVDDELGLTRLRAELGTEAGARRAPASTRALREIFGNATLTPRGDLPSP